VWACKLLEIMVVHYYAAFYIMWGTLQRHYMDTSCPNMEGVLPIMEYVNYAYVTTICFRKYVVMSCCPPVGPCI